MCIRDSVCTAMVAAIPIKYNFYHPNGTGRDGFISHTSEHQTNFSYVPKAPECKWRSSPAHCVRDCYR